MASRDLGARITLRILCVLVLGMAGWGAASLSRASIGPMLITMENWSPYYEPFEAVVQAHRPIKWMNPTPSPHTIRHDGCTSPGPCAFDSGAVPPDGTYMLPGLPPGRYPYHCEIHPIMRGELIVRTDDREAGRS